MQLGGGSSRSGSCRYRVDDILQIVEPERLFDERWRAVLLALSVAKFMAAQGDRPNSPRHAVLAETRALGVAQYHIRHQDIDRPDRQAGGRLGAILASGHIVTEISQDSCDE